jgi:UDP-3-O-[3-hydroxymyristoyl] glucosamine N-acyltransferase
MKFTAQQIADFIEGKVDGDSLAEVSSFAKIEEGKSGDLCFLSNMKYASFVEKSEASVIIVPSDFETSKKPNASLIRVEDPYSAFAKLLSFSESFKEKKNGISSLAFVDLSVKTKDSLYVGEFAVIQKGVSIGADVQIYPQVFIGENVKIGNNVLIYPGARILERCEIGDNCIIHSGVVIGSDGFGFAPNEKGEFKKIPQIGNVVIQNDVEIGANTTIDRATMGSTIIGKGSKLDNLIQIAHNVELGGHNVFAAQSGVAGSTKIGSYNMFGGQVGIAGHLKLGSKIKIAAQSGIMNNVEDEESLMGSPAMPSSRYFRIFALFRKLDEMATRVNGLEKKLK